MNLEKHEQLRQILIDSGAPEFGDIVIDKICGLFDYPDTTEFMLPKPRDVKTEDEARGLAIDWQNWQAEQSMSWGEAAHYADYFRKLAKKFKLTEEFKENAII
jgi:hypothetical protein